MRAALLLVVLAGCSKKAADRADQTSPVPAPMAGGNAAPAPEPTTGTASPPPPGGPTERGAQDKQPAANQPADKQQADKQQAEKQRVKEEARASGVLGPTSDGSAFAPLEPDTPKGRAALDTRAGGGEPVKPPAIVSIKTTDLRATKAVTGKRAALQACYAKALEGYDKLAGELVLGLEVGTLTVTRSTLKYAELETCVTDVLTKAALPKDGIISITLAFKRG